MLTINNDNLENLLTGKYGYGIIESEIELSEELSKHDMLRAVAFCVENFMDVRLGTHVLSVAVEGWAEPQYKCSYREVVSDV